MADRFRTGPGGFLLDRNGDGFVDDLALRIVLPHESDRLPVQIWRALIDLAARAGLETAGLPERLVLDAHEGVPPGSVRLLVLPSDPSIETSEETVVVRSAADIERLFRIEPDGDVRVDEIDAEAVGDLARLFEPGGILVDRDGDLIADGTRVCFRLPEPCPAAVGSAAIELAARIGLESGGIDLPIGLTAVDDAPTGAAVLDLSPRPAGDLPPGQGRLRLVDGEFHIDGDGPGIAELIRYLATTWPRMSADGGDEAEIGRSLDNLRDIATAVSSLGKVAALLAEADEIPSGSSVHMNSSDPAELELARAALHGRDITIEPEIAENHVFALAWEGVWEFDQVRELGALEIGPLIRSSDGEPFELLVAVSEPREVRAELERELLERLGPHVNVTVLSAYKLGLSWLREVVIPALTDLGEIDRVEIRYAPLEVGPGELDMRIRWLQELYPGDELLANALELPLSAIELIEGTSDDVYEVVAFRAGKEVWRDAISPFARSLPYIPLDDTRGSVRASTGGIRLRSQQGVVFERELPTDCDRFWHWFQAEVLPAVAEHIETVTSGEPRANQQPFFDALEVDVWLSEPDESLGIREELDSAAEALHEDVYFGALDWFAVYGEQRCGAVFDGPGSIVPLIHVRRGAPAARVTLRAKRRNAARVTKPTGERLEFGKVSDLLVPRFTVTGITVARGELQGIEVRVSGVDARTRSLLESASAVVQQRDGERAIDVTARIADEQSIILSVPLPSSPLRTVAPAQEPPPDDRIIFEADLPAMLARVARRPGAAAYQAGHSFRGRPLWVMEMTTPMPSPRWSRAKLSMQKPTVLIAARHHANEVASTTAAFLLAELLTTDGGWRGLLGQINVVIIPFENPDGAALHERLVAEHPTWKHHAARYNAVGFEYYYHLVDGDTPYGEARVRPMLNRRWRPDVVVDNHGVPSHEWSQHFSGFGSPPRFPVSYWMVQALLYGIMRHVDDPEHAAFAEGLRDRIAKELARHPDLHEMNAVYLDRYHRWGSSRAPERFPSEIHDGFLCYMSKAEPDPESRNLAVRMPRTMTLDWVTEVPDETVHGAQLAATACAHLIANRATIDLMRESQNQMVRSARSRPNGGTSIVVRRKRPLIK